MSNRNAKPVKIQPGRARFREKWKQYGGEANDINLQYLTQAITFESQAYICTLMKNYCHIALRQHVMSSLRYLWPKHSYAIYERAFWCFKTRKKLGLRIRRIIDRCLEVEDLPCARGANEQEEREANEDKNIPAREARPAVDMNKACIEAAVTLRMDLLKSLHKVQRWGTNRETGERERIRPRLFNLFPQAHQCGRFVTIDDEVARGILCRIHKTSWRQISARGALQRLFLTTSKPLAMFARQNYLFPHTVKTNGVQLNIPYEKYFSPGGGSVSPAAVTTTIRNSYRKNMQDETAESTADFSKATNGLFAMSSVPIGELPRDSIVGMDPGENNIVATTDGIKVGKKEFYSWRKPGLAPVPLKNPEKEANRRMKRMCRTANQARKRGRIVAIQESLMKAPMKTVGFGNFVKGLRLHNAHTATLQEYYGSRTRLDERFRQYIRQQKGLERLLTAVKIEPGSKKVVAMGRAYTGRKARHGDSLPVAPVKMVARALAKRCRVVMRS